MTSAQRLDQARELVAIVREMARTTILPRYLRAVREHKADGSVLTEADLAAQAALVESLPTLIHAPVLGEEMTAAEQARCGMKACMACGASTPSTAPPTSPTASPVRGRRSPI
jgi:3'-phosphoadenosine 5'-phosphosulfate (PAPS) 3'-phosphatase